MGKKAPKAPDPFKTAKAQTESNIATAREQARLGMTGQTSDFGSTDYVADANSPSGYRAVQRLSPEQLAILRGQEGAVTGALDRIGGLGDFDMSAARGREISDIQRTFLDPQFEQANTALESKLLNQGIRPGTEQYANAMRQFGQQRSDAYNKMFLDAYSTANNAALTERNLPLSDYSTLMGTMMQRPQTAQTPTPGVATTDITGLVQNKYNADMANYQNKMGGLFGLAGTLGSAMLSDRRMKRDIERIGTLANGLGWYSFRYLDSDEPQQGLMADEVRQVRPEAVVTIGGLDHVIYSRAVI